MNVSITSLAARPAGAGLTDALTGGRPELAHGIQLLFALTLLAAGLASATTGGMVSADVIDRLMPNLLVSAGVRRVQCLVPAVAVAACGLPEITVLLWSQVALTAALPLVLGPLVRFTCRPGLMRDLVAGPLLRLAATAVTTVLVAASVSPD